MKSGFAVRSLLRSGLSTSTGSSTRPQALKGLHSKAMVRQFNEIVQSMGSSTRPQALKGRHSIAMVPQRNRIVQSTGTSIRPQALKGRHSKAMGLDPSTTCIARGISALKGRNRFHSTFQRSDKFPNYFAPSGLRPNWDPHHDGLIPQSNTAGYGTMAVLFRPAGAVMRSGFPMWNDKLLVGVSVSSRLYGRIILNDPK